MGRFAPVRITGSFVLFKVLDCVKAVSMMNKAKAVVVRLFIGGKVREFAGKAGG